MTGFAIIMAAIVIGWRIDVAAEIIVAAIREKQP